jgi:hypothetical protein
MHMTLAYRLAFISLIGIVAGRPLTAQSALTAQDREQIASLTVQYARTLGNCEAEGYASLFEQPNGFYESVNRGRVLGKTRLVSLVESERHCNGTAERTARPAPTPTIAMSGDVVTGRVDLGANGHYEDVYVKTPAGWRFKSRNLIPKKAEEARFTYKDFLEIRAVAGDRGQFEDVYMDTPNGKRFRSSGLTIDPVSPTEATGKVQLVGDDGHYDDKYVKTSAGWRFASRTYVAAVSK